MGGTLRRVLVAPGRYREVTVEDSPRPEFPPIRIRNLLYHVAPFRQHGTWRWSVAQMCQRLPLFNGRRFVAIMTGGQGVDIEGARGRLETEDAAEVRRAFAGHRIDEFIEIPNDPTLREVAAFEPLFSRIETDDPEQATLYAHTKGATRPAGTAAHLWAQTVHELYLDYWPAMERLLRTHPLAGALMTIGRWAHGCEGWFYDGSWMWLRNREFFAGDWRNIRQDWSGIESYPSRRFAQDEAGLLFFSQMESYLTLYDWRTWVEKVLPALGRWRLEHAADYTGGRATPSPAQRLGELLDESRMDVDDARTFPWELWRRCDSVGGLISLLRGLPRLAKVCEVGCFRGVSTEVFLLLADHVQAVDPWRDNGEADGGDLYTRMESRHEEFQRRVGHYPNLSVLREASPAAAGHFPDGWFDLVYIDAAHDAASVRADVLAWMPKVRPGGWIAGHDYTPHVYHGATMRAIDDALGCKPDQVFDDTSWLRRVAA